MRLARFLKFIIVGTILALIYTQMQMQIFTLAYRGKFKEKQIRKLIEENGNVTYSILTLKSSTHLGGKMLSEESVMEFAGPQNVVEVRMPKKSFSKESLKKTERSGKLSSSLLSLISIKSEQAEASR